MIVVGKPRTAYGHRDPQADAAPSATLRLYIGID
jgi:hypothetical protein